MKTVFKMMPKSVYRVWPFILGILLVFLAVLPVSLPLLGTNFGPFIILTVIFHAALRYPFLLPSFGVFVLGLGYDMLSTGPLGYWALIFLSGYMVSKSQKYFLGRGQLVVCVAAFASISVLCGMFSWALGSIFYSQIAPVKDTLVGVVISILIYPAVYVLLSPVDRHLSTHSLQGLGRA